MENIAGDKMFAHVERALNDRRPITADIFLTNYCNNKCPYCTYRILGARNIPITVSTTPATSPNATVVWIAFCRQSFIFAP